MKILLLWLSLTGYLFCLRHLRKDLHPAFYPAVTVSLVSVAVSLGGMAGLLSETAWVLYGLGLLCFPVFGFAFLRQVFRRERGKEILPFIWMVCCFFLLAALMSFWLCGHFLYSYDDFSHWALAAKILLDESRLPVAADGLMFPSYPLGATGFVYFCGKMAGSEGSLLLLFQSVMQISVLLSLQSAAREKPAGLVLTTLIIPLFLAVSPPKDTLSVDTLLGTSFLAAVLVFLRYGNEMEKHGPEEGLLLACCTMIKNSGLFLALGLLLMILMFSLRKSRKFSPSLFLLLSPLLVFLMWRVHLNRTFTDFGKHFMSLRAYYGTLRARLSDLGTVFRIILPVVFSPLKNRSVWLLPAGFLLYSATSPSSRGIMKRRLLLCFLLLVLYDLGVICMYLCSMGIGEIVSQNGEDFLRYNTTIICAVAGALIFLAVDSGEKILRADRKKAALLLPALGFACLSLCLNVSRPLSLPEEYIEYPDAYAFADTLRNESLPDDLPVIVLLNAPEADDYHNYLANYYLGHQRKISLYGSAQIPGEGLNSDGSLLIDLREHRLYVGCAD